MNHAQNQSSPLPFIRVDVPNEDGSEVVFTRFFGPSAIYSMSPIAKDVALALAKRQSAEPVKRYEMPAALPEPVEERDSDRLDEEF